MVWCCCLICWYLWNCWPALFTVIFFFINDYQQHQMLKINVWFVFIWYVTNNKINNKKISLYVHTMLLSRGQVIIPTAHFSDSPLFRQPISPTAHYSDSPFLRQPIIPTSHYSDNDKYLHQFCDIFKTWPWRHKTWEFA
jgi:hypothetical protein